MMPKEIKDKIFALIEGGFVVDPRSKKTIIQNAGVCFRQFKYRLTTTYVLPFLDDVEKLKFLPNEYSFIDQQHWIEFVASRLKEEFKKKSENGKEKRKKHKYNHRTSRKRYANLMEELDELVATQKTTNAFDEEDILTRALGGKDRPGIVCGVGKYVTKKKKEEPGMSSKEKSSMEGAENLNDFEDLLNDLESQKDVEDVVELNEEIKVNIVKDDEQMEDVTLEKMKVGTPCKLAFEKKDHVVAWGTIFDSDVKGDNVKVVVDVVVDGDCTIPIPLEQRMYKMSQEMDYGKFTKDMTRFASTPIQSSTRFLLRMVEHMWYLYTRMESSRTLNLYKFIDTGSISCGSSKEERAQLLTVVQHNKEEITKVEDREGVVECGYYVMRFMWDIILSRSTSIIHIVLKVVLSVLLQILALHNPFSFKRVLLKCVVDHEVLLKCLVDHKVLLKCVVDHEVLLKCVVDHEVLLKCVVDHDVNVMCSCG
ncbi:uncharacterized protein E5676_scaffold24967G00360 [Cucumis melo var. makuwa]|uniref:Uncharacterized protein n=1 Tax=Cucumis melo var. makuwa TaxID=1194695 RepID=A0A5D3BXI3_CUCMM|nr:uncharacterized protein E5676_scaffold24967G00360 [Cucumis melo var. makuwa]